MGVISKRGFGTAILIGLDDNTSMRPTSDQGWTIYILRKRPLPLRVRVTSTVDMSPNTPVRKVISALAEFFVITALSKLFWWMHIPNRYSFANCEICLHYKLTVLLPCNGCSTAPMNNLTQLTMIVFFGQPSAAPTLPSHLILLKTSSQAILSTLH